MNTAKLQAFAQDARRQLMNAVSAQLDATLAENSRARTDEPGAVRFLEKTIEDETRKSGSRDAARQALIEQYAYRWFNRIIALRYMDVHGFTNIHVVSPADLTSSTALPEILAAAKRGEYDEDALALPGGEEIHDQVEALFNGTVQVPDPQGKAYGLLLLAECRYWHGVMPFMFEGAGDSARSYQADELLMPPDLLATGSVLRNAVVAMTPEDCGANVDGGFASGDSGNVEIIGWLYQFYISERKDEVMAGFKKNHKASSEEIPAATQLFTPDWIVRYLVQNTVGKLWTQSHPESQLHKSWEYYIEPDAGDTAQAEADDDHLVITTPQELTVCDPACGSGHMLTYAFDLLYQIYLEQGYTPSEIPGLILENNLYGMEIDERAASLAQFALMMKARAHDRRYFSHVVFPHICVVEPVEFNGTEVDMLNDAYGVDFDDETWNTYRHADVAGSLIQPSDELVNLSKTITDDALQGDPILDDRAAKVFRQSRYLGKQYAAVVANPPYMGSKNMGTQLKTFVQDHFKDGKADMFAAFMLRNRVLLAPAGKLGMVTMQSWMFLSSFEAMRKRILNTSNIETLAHLGAGAFDSIGGEVVSTVAFTLGSSRSGDGVYVRLVDVHGDSEQAQALSAAAKRQDANRYEVDQREFSQIPGSPIVYWLPKSLMETFKGAINIGRVSNPKKGITTGNNARFLRYWWEVSHSISRLQPSGIDDGRNSGWVPYNKGGDFRKWYGNREYLLDWRHNGAGLRAQSTASSQQSLLVNSSYWWQQACTWTSISSGDFSIRYVPAGCMFDNGGSAVFSSDSKKLRILETILNSSTAGQFLTALAPTLNVQPGDLAAIPLPKHWDQVPIESYLTATSKSDWDSYETSWDFTCLPLLDPEQSGDSSGFVETAVKNLYTHWCEVSEQQRERETRNNELVADAYGVRDDVPCDVPLERVSLKRNAAFAYPDKTPGERAQLFARDVVKELISYAVGCMFGRYSLDKPGLILASQGQTVDDYHVQVPDPSFAPDEDNVIPVTEVDCFDDDIVARFRAFLKAAFGAESLNANITFIEQVLGKDLRRYFVTDFYDDHVKTYASRPIYWEYSSRTNNRGAFKALVYLHRYTPSTTSTVLGYLRDFTTKITGIADALEKSDRTADHREADKLRKAATECREYEDKTLYPLATRNLPIDLDDGVLVNYLRMGDALRAIPSISKKRKDAEGWSWPVHPLKEHPLKESGGEESDNR